MNLTKKTTTIKQAAELLASKQRIALFAHTKPDGDTVGACVALSLGLQKMGKHVRIFCDSPLGRKLLTFEETHQISPTFEGKYDLMVAVDCGDVFRLGNFTAIYDNFAQTLTVDHHGGQYFSQYNCLAHYSSTCQMIFEILKELQVDIDSQIATFLYMGLCTDTGNFAHDNTDVASFLMAAELTSLGAEKLRVYQLFFRDITLAETKLTAKVLSRVRSYYDNKMFLIYVTKQDFDQFGLDSTATTGLVSNVIDIDTAKVGVCISEHANEVYKVSMRGKDFNVREVCQYFGGGGHLLASGCMINGMLEDVIEKIVRVVGFTL